MRRREILGGAFASLVLAACTPREEARCPEPQPQKSPPPPVPDRKPTVVVPKAGDKIRVLCIGAHPDDPETACGGTLARYAEGGHDVNVLYMTKGELGIVGKSPEETGA